MLRDMEGISIAESVKGCLDRFQALTLLALPLSNASHQASSKAITEEEPRFKIWSANIGAHASGRRSLQFRLRDASHLQKQVLALLTDLSELLEDALAIIQGTKVPWDQIELSDDSLEEDSDDDELPRTELEQIASSVPDTVNCLLRLSVAIRNPAPHDRFATSGSIDISHYEAFDIQHVQMKFQNVDNLLAQRLGNAISRRRQYFKYRESHHSKLAHGLDPKDQGDGKSTTASSIPIHAKNAGFGNKLSAVDEDELSDAGISQTSLASSLADTENLRIPPIPKDAESGPFECPFCYMIITATNRVSWKRHVFADLRPYVCLSDDCTAAEKSFARRHEWILHETENHWKFYVCPFSCSETFQSRPECVEHVHKSHPGTTPERQLEAMINLSSRPIRADDGMSCPMCHESLDSVKKYQRHVGRHQEQLAIFALPSARSLEDEDDFEKDDSNPSQSDVSSGGVDAVNSERHSEHLPIDVENATRNDSPDVGLHDSFVRPASTAGSGIRRSVARMFASVGNAFSSKSRNRIDDSDTLGRSLDFPEIPGEAWRNQRLPGIRETYHIPRDEDGNPMPISRSISQTGSFRSDSPRPGPGLGAIDDGDDQLRYAKNGGMDRNNPDQIQNSTPSSAMIEKRT